MKIYRVKRGTHGICSHRSCYNCHGLSRKDNFYVYKNDGCSTCNYVIPNKLTGCIECDAIESSQLVAVNPGTKEWKEYLLSCV